MNYCITKIRFVRLSVRPFARSPLDTTKEYQFRKWNGMRKRDPTKKCLHFFRVQMILFFSLFRVNGKFSIRYAQQILDDPNEISLLFVGLNIVRCDIVFFVHRTVPFTWTDLVSLSLCVCVCVSFCCQINAKMQSFWQREYIYAIV